MTWSRYSQMSNSLRHLTIPRRLADKSQKIFKKLTKPLIRFSDPVVYTLQQHTELLSYTS